MRISPQNIWVFTSILLLCAHPALAEVMDKEPAISQIWLWGLIASVCGCVICRWKPLWGAVPFAMISIYLFSVVTEWIDPGVGPLMHLETGSFYLLQICLAFVIVIFGHLLGIFFHRRLHQQRSLI